MSRDQYAEETEYPEDILPRIGRWILLGSAGWMVSKAYQFAPENKSAASVALVGTAVFLAIWGVLFWIDALDMRGLA